MNCNLVYELGAEFGEYAVKAPHLHEYAHKARSNSEFEGIPLQFKKSLSQDLRLLKKFNLIYPVSDNIFIHVFKGARDAYGRYCPHRVEAPAG